MATDIGKVGIVMKGEWDSSLTYETLDAVSYNNGLYIAQQDVPANTLPTDTTYWQNAVSGAFPTMIYAKESFTSSTTLAYTGVSLTIPQGKFYCVDLSIMYNNGQPLRFIVSNQSGSTAPWDTYINSDTAFHGVVGGYADTSITFYIFAQYSNASQNDCWIRGWYL